MAPASKWRIRKHLPHLWVVYSPHGKPVAVKVTLDKAMDQLCKILRHPAASLLIHSFSPQLEEYLSAVRTAPGSTGSGKTATAHD